MANKQQFIIEGIAKIDNVLDGIKKIQTGLGGLKVPDNLQKQFENLYKKAIDQGDKAKKALSSGFETKGSVKSYTEALEGISRIYSQILEKTKGLKIDKDFLNVNFDSLSKANAELERLKGEFKVVSDEAKKAKNDAQKVFTGVANYYGNTKNYKNPFKEWGEAAEALKKNDIPGVKAALDTLEQKFQGKNTDSSVWEKRYEAFKKLKNAFESYESILGKVTAADQQVGAQQQVVDKSLEDAQKALQPLVELMEKATKEADAMADAEGRSAKETQQLNSELEHFKNKAAYFFGLSNAINLFKRAVRSAYDTVKDLDAVMTETAVVTNFSVSDMWSQLPEYTRRANELGVTIHDTYEAATLFYQQGLKTNQVMEISNETLKMARIAGLDAATASDRMTNALRGFNMELDKTNAQRVNDVYSKLAAITASNTDEISTAMTKVASLAHNANMEFETTAAFLAQIIESTRESAETAGTALKTVVARFSEVKKLYSKGELMGQDEEGEEIDVNKVSTALRSAGINLNEYLTGAKGLDSIFIELAGKWDSLDQVQQRYIATMAAGSRQQSRFIALMSNSARTTELVTAANNANGASQEQYEKTLESLQTKLARLKNAWNEFILGLANSDAIKTAVDMLTGLITAINSLIKLISGKNAGAKMITTFFTAFTAFKIGSKLVGKNSGFSKFLASFLGKDAEQIASLKGKDLAKSLYSSLADKIANPEKSNFKNPFEGLRKYFLTNNKSFFDNLYTNFDFNVGDDKLEGFYKTVGQGLDNGTLTVGQLNKALKDCGQNFEITKENAEQFGITMEDENSIINNDVGSMRRLSAGAMALGGILMIVGSKMEEMEGPAKDWGTIIKGLGAGLLVFGTIMSVYLPLQAQLMAKGVSTAIASIPIVGWIAALISAVIALGVAIGGVVKNHSAETKLEKAAEAAEKAAQAAEDAKKAFNELNEAWDKLDDKYAVIENATKGTTEWKNAVKELNDQVLELMETYEGIEIKRNSDGILEITTDREEYTEAARNKALEAEGAARISKIDEYNRINDVRFKRLNSNSEHVGIAEGYRPLIEKAIKEGYLEKLAEATDEEIMDLYKATPSTSELVYVDTEKSRRGLGKSVREYAKNYAKNQNAIRSEEQALGATALEKANVSEDLKKYANTFLSNEYLDNLIKESSKKHSENNAKQEYADSKGFKTWNDYIKVHKEDKDLTDKEVLGKLISADSLEKASDQIKLFTDNLSQLTDAEKAFFEQQGGGALTYSQADTLSKYSKKQREKLYNDLGGDKVYGKNGFKNYFEEWFKNTVDKAASNFNVEANYGKEFSDKLSKSLTEGLDSESFKSFTENMWSVVTASGYKGMEELQDSLTEITQKMKPENRRGFISSLKQIDWTSSNSIHTLSNLAKEYGISENEADKLEKQIIKLNKASAKVDLTKATEQIKSLLGISKKVQIGSQGRSFTEEQVKQLTEAGMDASKFQYNIETGQYDYTGVLDDIRKAVNKLVEETFNTEQLEKDVASSKAANEAIDSEKENTTDYGKKAELVDNYIKAAGEENSKINKKWFDYASSEASKGNFEILDKLVAIVEKEAGEYLNRKKTLEGTVLNKDVMMHQLNSGNKNAHLANNGDLAATKALEGQVSSSNMSEELKQKLLSGMDGSLEGGYGRMQYKEMAGNMVDTFDQAKAYGIENTELEAYAKSLQQVNGLEKLRIDNLYQLSLAEINYQKGQQSLYDTQEQWSKLINKKGQIIPDGTIEQAKIYSKLKQDIKQMLNLSEDLPDSFLKSKTNVDLLKKAVKGNKDAVEKLRTAAAKVQLKNIDIKKEGLKDKITNAIDELSKKMPDLKIGASLDSTDAGKDLMDFVNKAGMSVEDIQKLFNSLGWAPDIKWKDLSYTDAVEASQNGTVYQYNPESKQYEPVDLKGNITYDTNQRFFIPQIGPNTSKVASKPPKKNPPKKKSKKGGGGKKSKAKKERWENPYDELYNLQEKINEALRTREALERRYQKLLKQEQTSLSDIRKSYYDQIKQIRYEANLQKELEAGRRRQINNIGKETYVDSKGKVKTFDQMGVTKYAKFNFKTGEIEMDWAGIQALEGTKNVEKGKAVEAYVSKLQELVQSYEEVRDKLWELEDKIEEYRQAVIDTFLSFEDRVLDAVVNKYQKEIDNYQAMSDAIDKVNNEVLKSLREQVDLSRQIRDNTKKEEDISKKENRLAYLQRDTSGANDLEILNLQKELKDARENYSDELIDQAIDKMQDDADKASEQRQRQIEIMQTQLDIARDTGALWDEVYDLMSKAAASEIFSEDSELAKLLKDGEAFKALSNIGQAKWWEEVGTAFRQAIIGRDEAEDKYKKDADNNGTIANTGTSDYLKEIGEMNTQANVTPNTYERTDEQNYGAAAAIVMGGKTHGGWGAKNTDWASNLKEKGFDSGLVLDLVEVFNTQKAAWDKEQAAIQKAKGKYKKGKKKGKWKYTVKPWTGWKTMGVTDWKKYQMSQFRTGGLADSTGPAWLDGTKTKPELVLNAQDTKNFITLKDILASLMGGQGAGPTSKGGDNYFDINISADIGSDYDVDRLASRIKKQIYEDGQYRNVNTINFLR